MFCLCRRGSPSTEVPDGSLSRTCFRRVRPSTEDSTELHPRHTPCTKFNYFIFPKQTSISFSISKTFLPPFSSKFLNSIPLKTLISHLPLTQSILNPPLKPFSLLNLHQQYLQNMPPKKRRAQTPPPSSSSVRPPRPKRAASRRSFARESPTETPPTETPTHTVTPQHVNDPRFRTLAHEERYNDDISTREILHHRFFDPAPIAIYPGLEFLDWIENSHLGFFVGINVPFYQDSIKEFYSNLNVEYNGIHPTGLVTRVSNIDITLNLHDLRTLFYIPEDLESYLYLGTETCWRELHVGHLEATTAIYAPGTRKFNATHLNFHCHLAHRLFTKILCPVKSSKDTVTSLHTYYLYAMRVGHSIDLAGIFLLHIDKILRTPNLCLAYGSVITHILNNLVIPPIGVPEKPMAIFTISILKMGFITWDRTAMGWTWNGVLQTNLDGQNAPPHTAIEPPPSTAPSTSRGAHSSEPSTSSSSFLVRMVKALYKRVIKGFKSRRKRERKLETKIDRLYNHMRSFNEMEPDSVYEANTLSDDSKDDDEDAEFLGDD